MDRKDQNDRVISDFSRALVSIYLSIRVFYTCSNLNSIRRSQAGTIFFSNFTQFFNASIFLLIISILKLFLCRHRWTSEKRWTRRWFRYFFFFFFFFVCSFLCLYHPYRSRFILSQLYKVRLAKLMSRNILRPSCVADSQRVLRLWQVLTHLFATAFQLERLTFFSRRKHNSALDMLPSAIYKF